MVEYIEKQAAVSYAISGMVRTLPTNDGNENWIRTSEVRKNILSIPVEDVVPVVHSRWIKYTGMGKVQWMCEKCSAEEKNPKVANYCYHCGAKMDGGMYG